MDSSTPASPILSGANTPLGGDEDISSLSWSSTPIQTKSQSGSVIEGSIDLDVSPVSFTKIEDHIKREKLSKLLKGKEKEWSTVTEKRGPLRLLDLPVDILKEIIHHLPHTNDLTSLALCHSAFHSLTVPYIYSRFDIVWPDQTTHAETRTGVDALTYGLATLVMAEEIFGEAPHQKSSSHSPCSCTSSTNNSRLLKAKTSAPQSAFPLPKRRRGNYYAQFTKKFSLGNGPADWVQEYLITKEGGKMLGTLVALAVARMKNLETFVWDMPTGVLRDVWLALSSLADRNDDQDCRLDRLWIRWHDNTQTDLQNPVPPPIPINNIPPPPPPPPPNMTHPLSGVGAPQAPIVVPIHHMSAPSQAIDRVEHPTFSVIPSISSLSVLDIDELPYLDEMSILIARSQFKLRELRVGIARHAQQRDWVTAWEGDGVQQVDHTTTWTAASRIGEKRQGGVLGVLIGRIYNMRHNVEGAGKSTATNDPMGITSAGQPLTKGGSVPSLHQPPGSPPTTGNRDPNGPPEDVSSSTGQATTSVDESTSPVIGTLPSQAPLVTLAGGAQPTSDNISVGAALTIDAGGSMPTHLNHQLPNEEQSSRDLPVGPFLNGKLRLEILELERVPLSVSVLLRAFDWSLLTTLTLLNCNNHEQLWKALRRAFSPKSLHPTHHSIATSPSHGKHRTSTSLRSEYSLNLKKIHTNAVSPSLITFLKETLAPNSLEVLFLQEGRSYTSTVTVDAIYRGPVRRHRASLKKLMIDSSEKGPDGHATSSTRWNRWMLNREILTFITSGRMTSLRELAVTIDYEDWHFLLQRLPLISHIRSLYIPYIADHVHGNNIDPRELALQIVDIVHLRPEVELCYMGILTKCFEILENKQTNYDRHTDSPTPNAHDEGTNGQVLGGAYVMNDAMISDDEGDETEEEEETDEDVDSGVIADDGDDDLEDDEDGLDDSEGEDSFTDEFRKGPKLRLREILFYDDKVAIFKARHGRL